MPYKLDSTEYARSFWTKPSLALIKLFCIWTSLFWDAVDSFAGFFDGFNHIFTVKSTSKADKCDNLGSMKILNTPLTQKRSGIRTLHTTKFLIFENNIFPCWNNRVGLHFTAHAWGSKNEPAVPRFVKRTCSASAKIAGKRIIEWFLLTIWENSCRAGSLREIRNSLKYQFQQGNSLKKKLILKNKKFSCVEGLRDLNRNKPPRQKRLQLDWLGGWARGSWNISSLNLVG